MVEFALRLLAGTVPFSEFLERTAASEKLQTLTLVTNYICNLNCSHCYLQVNRPTGTLLTAEEWLMLLDSVPELDPELVCLSGKEVFADRTGAAVLGQLDNLRCATGCRFRSGVITNGTLLAPYRDAIVAAKPSYFDISLDGMETEHDALRGKGSFARSWPNVLWASRVFGDAFFVNLTLQKHNVRRIREILSGFSANGIANVEIGFYIPTPYTDRTLSLSTEDLRGFFANLDELRELRFDNPLRIHMDLDTLTLNPLLVFLRSRWFSPGSVVEDGKGELLVIHSFGNGLSLEIRLAPFPVGIWRSTRITPEGSYLAAEDTLDTRFYESRSLGNIRDHSFDLVKLHACAQKSTRLRDMANEYYKSVLPLLRAAFDGNKAAARDSRTRAQGAA